MGNKCCLCTAGNDGQVDAIGSSLSQRLPKCQASVSAVSPIVSCPRHHLFCDDDLALF